MSDFDPALTYVLRNEGGYVNNPNDSGGSTGFGLSLRFLKNLPPEKLREYAIYDNEITDQTIRDLTLQQAKAIYKGEFWNHAPFDKILNQEHCNYIFDMCFNMGISPAIKCVQRACWAVMKRRDLVEDGILGEKTLLAIKMCGFLIMPPMRSERAGYYRLVANHSEKDKEFLQGWLNRAYESK